ncbi:Phosphogluconate dehydratase [Stutzerimonas stutzeri]
MPSGIPNKEKAEVRQRYAEGKASREELLESRDEVRTHSPGTCTFYGTANTNQVVMEIMGLHLPGSSFVNPYTPLRDALTREAARQVVRLTHRGRQLHAAVPDRRREGHRQLGGRAQRHRRRRPITPCTSRHSPAPPASS